MLNLKNSQVDVGKPKVEKLPDYKNYSQKDFLKEMADILCVPTPVEKINAPEGRISLEEIAGEYVFTADNFVKMVLILIRIRSGIPVIMMGETGCGKTSLIRMLSQMQNEGDKQKMKILNIHAGTNDEDIIKFMNKFVIPEAEKILKEEEEKKNKFLKERMIFEFTKVWVFLDEINTVSISIIFSTMKNNF